MRHSFPRVIQEGVLFIAGQVAEDGSAALSGPVEEQGDIVVTKKGQETIRSSRQISKRRGGLWSRSSIAPVLPG